MDDPSKLEPSSPPFAEIGPKDDNINTTSSTVSGGSTSSTPVPENNIPSLPFELPQPPIIPQENNEMRRNKSSRTIQHLDVKIMNYSFEDNLSIKEIWKDLFFAKINERE
ncbi:hypothetical protein Tco_0347432 [Tanacetum coccineum]